MEEHKVRDAIPMGNDIYLSIQASRYHYCTPKELLETLGQYEEVELAIINEGNDYSLVYPSKLGLPKELDEHFEISDSSSVAAYVPWPMVRRIMFELLKLGLEADQNIKG